MSFAVLLELQLFTYYTIRETHLSKSAVLLWWFLFVFCLVFCLFVLFSLLLLLFLSFVCLFVVVVVVFDVCLFVVVVILCVCSFACLVCRAFSGEPSWKETASNKAVGSKSVKCQ